MLSRENARDALANEIAEPLGLSVETAAVAVGEVVDENMANAARVHAVESGKDLGGFTMVAYGGGAPLHACRLCEKLGISTLLVPPGAGVGSAIGFLRAPVGYEAVRGAYLRLADFDAAQVNAIVTGLTEEAVAIARSGNGSSRILVEAKAFMRYRGQGWEIPVPLPDDPFDADGGLELKRRFEIEYAQLFGRPLSGLDVEVMNWSVRAVTAMPPAVPVPGVERRPMATVGSTRQIFDLRTARFVPAAVVERRTLRAGETVIGPAVIVERETTTVVTAAFEAAMQADGSLLLRKREAVDA